MGDCFQALVKYVIRLLILKRTLQSIARVFHKTLGFFNFDGSILSKSSNNLVCFSVPTNNIIVMSKRQP